MNLCYHKLIYSEKQVLKFVNILPLLQPDESYFISMSARNKYLSSEEKISYDLGRTEMFARKLVKCSHYMSGRDDNFMRVLRSMEVVRGGYTSRSNIALPDKCLVVYANINPVSGKKALKMFCEKSIEMLFNERTDNFELYNMSKLDTILMNCYQKSSDNRKFIDVDVDIPQEGYEFLEKFIFDLKSRNVTHYVIQTKSGYHVLLDKDTLNFNYNVLIKHFNEVVQKFFGTNGVEVLVNTNNMIPIPGTLQAGFEVKMLEL